MVALNADLIFYFIGEITIEYQNLLLAVIILLVVRWF